VEERRLHAACTSPDRHGCFRARFLAPGRYFVRVNGHRGEQGWARPIAVEVRSGEDVGPLEVDWLPCPDVELTVTAADGAPVTGKITVQAMPVDDGEQEPPGGMLPYFQMTLDENGFGVMKALAARAYHVQITADGRSAAKTVDVQESRTPPLRIQLPER